MAIRALAVQPNHSVLTTLRDELRVLDVEIQERQEKRAKIQILVDMYTPGEPQRRQAARPMKVRPMPRKPARGTRGLVPNRTHPAARPSTVEMARQVLKNEGAPMSPKQIGEKIFETFGF